MKINAGDISYESLVASYETGCLQTSDFILTLEEQGWFDRYVDEYIGMVDSNLPFAEAFNTA